MVMRLSRGAWEDVSALISVINNNLDAINTTHPTSGVTVEKRIATSFTSTTPPCTGTPYKSDSNQNVIRHLIPLRVLERVLVRGVFLPSSF